jgi:hypothetical protein
MAIKRIVCLANSKKLSGRCVAGREVGSGGGNWIRPVSARPSEEVSENERQYEDGSDPRVLDIIEIPLVRAAPHACQTENWLIDPERYWRRIRRIGWDELQNFVETPTTLWVNGESTYRGENDELLQAVADAQTRSLYLIGVEQIELRVFAPSAAFGNPKRRVQTSFTFRGAGYSLWVTDPVVERDYLARPDGRYRLGACCLTISLGEPFRKSDGQSCRYKLVAAIIRRDEGPWP